MSQEEQDLIFGRLSRESKELGKQAAALTAKLAEMGMPVLMAGKCVMATDGEGAYFPQINAQVALDWAKSMPEKQVFIDTLQELQSVETQKATADAKLKAMS